MRKRSRKMEISRSTLKEYVEKKAIDMYNDCSINNDSNLHKALILMARDIKNIILTPSHINEHKGDMQSLVAKWCMYGVYFDKITPFNSHDRLFTLFGVKTPRNCFLNIVLYYKNLAKAVLELLNDNKISFNRL